MFSETLTGLIEAGSVTTPQIAAIAGVGRHTAWRWANDDATPNLLHLQRLIGSPELSIDVRRRFAAALPHIPTEIDADLADLDLNHDGVVDGRDAMAQTLVVLEDTARLQRVLNAVRSSKLTHDEAVEARLLHAELEAATRLLGRVVDEAEEHRRKARNPMRLADEKRA